MTTTAVYTDFSSLGRLKADASRDSPAATREAARQFEALFVQMMLKSMRDAGAVLAEDRDTSYEEMFDHQIALELTRNKGIGIADILVRQLDPDAAILPTASPRTRPRVASLQPVQDAIRPVTRENWQPAGPTDFLRDIWPLAQRAAAELQVDPRALAAQAALETGWGQRLIRDQQGVSGNNLFGIKADQRWAGDRVSVTTLEYDGGIPRRLQAQFRAYPSLREGFDDYVSFLQDNPRYREAVGRGLSAEDFAVSLQEAGYATDPRYAEKIRGILESPRFEGALGGLKDAHDLPI